MKFFIFVFMCASVALAQTAVVKPAMAPAQTVTLPATAGIVKPALKK